MNKHQPILEKYAAETQKFFESLPINEIERLNKKTFDSSDAEYKQFKSFLEKSFCYICGEKIDGFILDKPCMHWLLRPTGFDKKHFPLVFKKFNFLRIESFLRWIATTEILAGNINDLKEETNPSKLFEHTIKYKNFDWSFSCSKSDLAGHKFSFSGRAPHCHFQMRING